MNELLAKIIDAHQVDSTIRERRWPFLAQGRAARFESAPHDGAAARGTLVCVALWRSLSAHDVHLRQDRHREAQFARWLQTATRPGTHLPVIR